MQECKLNCCTGTNENSSSTNNAGQMIIVVWVYLGLFGLCGAALDFNKAVERDMCFRTQHTFSIGSDRRAQVSRAQTRKKHDGTGR